MRLPAKVKDARMSTFCSLIVNTHILTLTCKLTPTNFVLKVIAGKALNMYGGFRVTSEIISKKEKDFEKFLTASFFFAV